MVLVIGENIKVRRFALFTEGVSVPYIHAGGKIGVLVNLKVRGPRLTPPRWARTLPCRSPL